MQLSQTIKLKEIELIIRAAFKFCVVLEMGFIKTTATDPPTHRQLSSYPPTHQPLTHRPIDLCRGVLLDKNSELGPATLAQKHAGIGRDFL